ncbi:MAG: hypothetical protein WBP72_14980 [Rhodocyclaceae bacterium]
MYSGRIAAAIGLLGLGAIGLPHHASAAQSETDARQAFCSDASLRGTYGFTARGTTLAGVPIPPTLLGPFASAGSATYNGKGRVSLASMASFNGSVQPANASGSYKVTPDCSFTSALENGTTFQAVIVSGGDELLVLQTSPFTVIAGTARKQDSAPRRPQVSTVGQQPCSNRNLRGTYGFIVEGRAGPPTVPAASAGPLDGVGLVSFGGNGDFNASARRSVNGTLDPTTLPLPGQYSVGRDCTVDMQFDAGFHFSGVIADDGDRIEFVETDPGTTLTVTAIRL